MIQDRVQRLDRTHGLWGRLVGPQGSTDVLAMKSSALHLEQLDEALQAAQDAQKQQKSKEPACEKAPPNRWHCGLKPVLSLLHPDQGSGREKWGLPISSSSLGTSCTPSAQPAGKHHIPSAVLAVLLVLLKAPSEAPCGAAGFIHPGQKRLQCLPQILSPEVFRAAGPSAKAQPLGAVTAPCHAGTLPHGQQPSPSSLPPLPALFVCYFHPSAGLPVFLPLHSPPPFLSCSSLIGRSGRVRGEPCNFLYNQVQIGRAHV